MLPYILKIVKYAPREGRGWQLLLEFLSKKKPIINIKNIDKRCFGYSILYFLERVNLPKKHCFIISMYKTDMFELHHLDTLYYPISPNNVHLYEDQLQININVCSYFDDEGHARHPQVVSRKNYECVVNLLY